MSASTAKMAEDAESRSGSIGAATFFRYEGAVRYAPLVVCGGFFVATILLFADSEATIEANTYVGKIAADGWEPGLMWSTFFVYPAADITFFGTIVLMFGIGFVWSLSWRDAIERQDVLALVVYFQLSILVFYLSANNQVFQGGETTIGFVVVLFAWLARRGGWRVRRRAALGAR